MQLTGGLWVSIYEYILDLSTTNLMSDPLKNASFHLNQLFWIIWFIWIIRIIWIKSKIYILLVSFHKT